MKNLIVAVLVEHVLWSVERERMPIYRVTDTKNGMEGRFVVTSLDLNQLNALESIADLLCVLVERTDEMSVRSDV